MEMKSFKNQTILVTGGTGFVGSHLVERLLKEKANVITTYKALDPKSYFFTRKLQKKTTLAHVDIVDFERVFDLITKYEVDFIFHLAAQPLVDAAYYNPRRTMDSNIRGTVNILESARLYPRVKGVIFASSDKAYGKLTKEKYLESDPLRGDHPYEVSKSAADLIAYSYYKTYGVPVVITRFGNIYGEGDTNYSRIIPGIMKAIINDEVLSIRSDGKYVRDYLYVKDVAEGYLMIAKKIESIVGQAFNFGSKETISVLALIKIVEKAVKRKLKYKILNNAQNEIPYQSLDYSKIKKKIGWEPKKSLKKTSKSILAWYKKVI